MSQRTSSIHNDEKVAEAIQMAQKDFSSVRENLIELIMRAMLDACERAKMSMILPQIMENQNLLERMVFGTRFEPAIRLVDDYFRRRDIIIKSHRSPLADHGMVRIIDFFQRNNDMYKLFPGCMAKLSLQERQLLNAFEVLVQLAKDHLHQDAKTRIENEKRLQKIYRENVSIVEDIEQMKARLTAQDVKIRWKKFAKLAIENKSQKELIEKRRQNEFRAQQEKEKTRRYVNEYEKKSLENQARLTEELKNLKIEILRMEKESKKHEKNARDEKNKLQIQLEAIIKKYDSTIGEKRTEILNLKDKYTEDTKKLKEFMTFYRKEAAVYDDIVVKREKQEERAKQQKILRFMMNRAAHQIQRYWRKWQRHMAKKNKKNKKKK